MILTLLWVSNVKSKRCQNSGYSISNHFQIVCPNRGNECWNASFSAGQGECWLYGWSHWINVFRHKINSTKAFPYLSRASELMLVISLVYLFVCLFVFTCLFLTTSGCLYQYNSRKYKTAIYSLATATYRIWPTVNSIKLLCIHPHTVSSSRNQLHNSVLLSS